MTRVLVDDTIFQGTTAGDTISAFGNNIEIWGRGGRDLLSYYLTESIDDHRDIRALMAGGAGNDQLYMSFLVSGAVSGNDIFDLWTSAFLYGDEGDDVLRADLGSEGVNINGSFFGGAGDDTITVSVDPLRADAPNYTSIVGIDAGEGNDIVTVRANASGTTSYGTQEIYAETRAGDDVVDILARSSGSDSWAWVSAGPGADQVRARAIALDAALANMNSYVSGGAGDDVIDARSYSPSLGASTTVFSGAGDDTIFASADGSRAVTLKAYGGSGDDRIVTRLVLEAGDWEYPGHRYSRLKGGDGDDHLTSTIVLRDGAERIGAELEGGAGNDRLSARGGEGNVLAGGSGRDTLLGSGGSDELIGGAGADRLRGGGGADSFVFDVARGSAMSQRDLITDFTTGTDQIDLSGIDAKDWRSGNQAFTFDATGTGGGGQVWIERSSSGSDSLLYADTGGERLVVTLRDGSDIDPSDYSASDFIL